MLIHINLYKKWIIYILKCEKDKYYVGRTKDLTFRIEDHFRGKGSEWTTKYKPLKIKKLIKHCDPFDEDKYVIMLMNEKGIDNVRGGRFSQVTLSEVNKEDIKHQINSALDNCFKCGEKSHFIRDCKLNKQNKSKNEKKDGDGDEVNSDDEEYEGENEDGDDDDEEEYEEGEEEYEEIEQNIITPSGYRYKQKDNCCDRCGRNTHFANDCYATTHLNGGYIDNEEDDEYYDDDCYDENDDYDDYD